jgi:hypothetical protein
MEASAARRGPRSNVRIHVARSAPGGGRGVFVGRELLLGGQAWSQSSTLSAPSAMFVRKDDGGPTASARRYCLKERRDALREQRRHATAGEEGCRTRQRSLSSRSRGVRNG